MCVTERERRRERGSEKERERESERERDLWSIPDKPNVSTQPEQEQQHPAVCLPSVGKV